MTAPSLREIASEATPWGVHHLRSMIAPPGVMAGLPNGLWVRAVPEPYSGTLRERFRAAWWVLTQRAYAVVWPQDGELESALNGLPPPLAKDPTP